MRTKLFTTQHLYNISLLHSICGSYVSSRILMSDKSHFMVDTYYIPLKLDLYPNYSGGLFTAIVI
jgi:hypothetical protein